METTLGSTPSAIGRFGQQATALGRDIKLAHSVFALPFALLAAFLAAGSQGRLPGWAALGLIVLCMVAARTAAMSVNRLADRTMDAANPRTAGRALPSGTVSPWFAGGAIAVSAAVFLAGASGFWWLDGNPWPALLSPLVLGYLAGYSFTKRFTAACHLLLGLALALSPIAAVIAIAPGYLASPAPWLLAAMVTGWVAGFDVIYALQDLSFDRQHGMYSIPAKLGARRALRLSRTLHISAALILVVLGFAGQQLGMRFTLAVAVAIGLLGLEHGLVALSKKRRLPRVFMSINGLISLLIGAAGILDVVNAV